MPEHRLDHTDERGPLLQQLDALIRGDLGQQIDDAVTAARTMLAGSDEPFGWDFIDLGAARINGDVRSGGVFVLPGDKAPPAHRHPNSIQHMRLLSGEAIVILRSAEGADRREVRVRIGEHDPWVVIARDVEHEFELSSELVVLSFHTVPQSELREVDASGERTYGSPDA
jgi:hypothetical protein